MSEPTTPETTGQVDTVTTYRELTADRAQEVVAAWRVLREADYSMGENDKHLWSLALSIVARVHSA